MENNIKKLQEERIKLHKDFYNNILPKRLPVSMKLPVQAIAEYANENKIDCLFDHSKIEKAAEELCEKVYEDVCPISLGGIPSRPAQFYQLLKSKSFVLNSSGYIQHPESSAMEENEYPALIEDAYAFILEKVIPRQYKALSIDDPVKMVLNLQLAKNELNLKSDRSRPFINSLKEKFGYYPGAPKGSMGFTAAPYDFIADQLRGFSEISKDIRRRRDELKEACDAVLPLMFKFGLTSNPDPEGMIGCPLHMPTFMREKDFDEIWLPSFKKMVEEYAARGMRIYPFCEDDWTRYADQLHDFPAGSYFIFEKGDAQKIKDRLGKKHLITGLYPITLIKTGTKQQVIDKAKELLDVMMPHGGYYFGFDKGPITLSDINLENYIALSEFVRDYAVYPNAGESFGMALNSEGFKPDQNFNSSIKSKYIFNWEEYKKQYPLTPDFAKKDIDIIEMDIISFYLNLLL